MRDWCCHIPYLYKFLPELQGLVAIAEFICGIVRLIYFFSPLSNQTPSGQKYESMYIAAFIIDWISSIVPTLMGLFVALLIIVLLVKILIYCLQKCTDGTSTSSLDNVNTDGWLRSLLKNKAMRRVIVMDCNCPCYKTRPKLRFQARFGFLLLVLILRIIAISLYVSASSIGNHAANLSVTCAVTVAFLACTFLLELYHHCVWWHYTPYLDKTCCCYRSRKHVRYIPYLLFGKYREDQPWTDEKCNKEPCPKRGLEHIAIFHHSRFQPQPRWNSSMRPLTPRDPNKKIEPSPTYIGFHQTTPENAVSIAQSEFLPSSRGMLGPGTYFARSIDATTSKVGREGGRGAWLIAEISMGKVFQVDKRHIYSKSGDPNFNPSLQRYVSGGEWHTEYDTCYLMHPDEFLDEFCIKDPKTQILRWVIIIDEPFDRKVKLFGLDTEFSSTKCGCL